MKIASSILLVLIALVETALSLECGQWYSSDCICDTDIRYCADGEKGASDNILDQHPFWKDYQGYYSFEIVIFTFGKIPRSSGNPEDLTLLSTRKGFMNQTIKGSRTYNHRYEIDAPNPNANCTGFINPNAAGPAEFLGVCGVNGHTTVTEGFGTGTPERDGSIATTTKLQPATSAPGPQQSITDDDAEYKQVPVDENTLFGVAKSKDFLVTVTFSFTNTAKTAASAVQDVYMSTGEDTSVLVLSQRMTFTKLDDDADSFIETLTNAYDEFKVVEASRATIPPQALCSGSHLAACPTEEDFCEIDPRCTATNAYEEPDATTKAGPIVGIVVAVFVVVIGVLYVLHLQALKKRDERNRAVFARRIAETIKLEGPSRKLTPEALAEEFKKIDNGNVDGSIDKDELRAFVNSGKVGKMNESDFNTLFAALDTDGDGTVSFIEFSAYMGRCYDDFDKLKSSKSVKLARGQMMDDYYSGVSKRILSSQPIKEEEEEEEEKDIKEEKADDAV